MSTTKAKILYDYNPENETDLKINVNEYVDIIDQDVGSGWLKARDKNGYEGRVPASYVTIINMSESDFETSDEEETQSNTEITSIKSSNSTSIPSPEMTQFGNIKMPKAFLKSGGEDFLLGQGKTNEVTEAKVEVIMDNGFEVCQWHSSNPGQTCKIVSHEKTSRFNGLDVYIQYVLESTYDNGVVKRRYRHFVWLHQVLTEKFPCVVIPPLPPKKAIVFLGNMVDTFILSRQKRLQKWLTHITKHPVLSNSYVVRHFLTSNDKIKWNLGKKKSQSDIYQGAKFFLTVDSSLGVINWDVNSERLEKVLNFIETFDKSSRAMQESFVIFHRRQSKHICKEFSKIGSAVSNVAKSMGLIPDSNRSDIDLYHGLQRSGDTFFEIGKLIDEQSKLDHDLLDENLEEINECSKEIVSLIDLAKGATTTALCGYQRMSENAETVDKNLRVITRTADAELSWIQKERGAILRSTMKQYWQNQLDMYTNITTFITETLSNL